jgi:hypothetical protein
MFVIIVQAVQIATKPIGIAMVSVMPATIAQVVEIATKQMEMAM